MTLRSDNTDSLCVADLAILNRISRRIAPDFPELRAHSIEGAVRSAVPDGVIDEEALEHQARRALMTPTQLKLIRQALGLGAEAFASLVGAQSGRTVRRWESGDRDIPAPVVVLTWLLLEVPAARDHLGLQLGPTSVTRAA